MSAQDPDLEPEVVTDDSATPPPVATEMVELEASNDAEGKGQDEKPQEDQADQKQEVQLLIEGEEPPPERESAAPQWIKDLRKEHRDLKAKNAELERELKAKAPPAQASDPGPKPTLDGCDYDTDRFERELETWRDRKQVAAQREAAVKVESENQSRAWNDRLRSYGAAREELTKQIPSFPEAEAFTKSILDLTQQSIIVSAADTPALVVCALGQNPKLAQDLANEKDPVKFAFKVAKLEARLKMSNKATPPPEKPVKGTGSVSGAVDSQLERLRAEADRTGDFSKVVAYKQQKRDRK